jgi:hypothetical protein
VPVVILSVGLFVGSLVGGTALANHQFSDVGTNSEFHDEIDWLADSGIANGFPDGTFRPSQPVSRQAMAAFLARQNAGLHLVSSDTDPAQASTFTGSASCPIGERAIGGGGNVDVSEVFLTDSVPSNGQQGWSVRFESDNDVPRNPSSIQVWAMCMPDAPELPAEM